jgi:Plavaka transposase
LFTEDIPRADIHDLILPDILHQIVKGAFKDHVVEWIESYITNIVAEHNEHRAQEILDDID